ncbi:M20 family metallopeptidase [Bacillus sp. CGMCC 1.16541]|uniref:M20 metallopeptidase family protein n=1 Tax=Bacillus sp. CGMCC 1.16541 TaxID=2185143 RepID=UPI000D738C86|nr:M20 family metallopeptidase [Bacillus sp. CGMCC 1.16541]
MSKSIRVSPSLAETLTSIQQHLHKYPELSFQEFQTCEFIVSILNKWNIPFTRVGETGIFVDIVGQNGAGPHIGIRADIDALPIEEKTDLDFASVHQGVMHACGHDGHTAILLGTIYQLYHHRHLLCGRVRCIFQPGEEADGAAHQLIQLGVLENPKVDEMVALHLWPHLPHGTVGVKYGAVTASCDDFKIEIKGKGGHSARPHQAIDAIMIGTHLLQALPTIVTKLTNPVEPVVIHVGKIRGGTASNVVADSFVLTGTTRTVTRETRAKVKHQLTELAEKMAGAFGGKADVLYEESHPPVINDEMLTKRVEERARELFGDERVVLLKEPSMGADDFGAFAEVVPSTYIRLGTALSNQPVYDLHHPQFTFDSSIISIGVELFTQIVLNKQQKGGVNE